MFTKLKAFTKTLKTNIKHIVRFQKHVKLLAYIDHITTKYVETAIASIVAKEEIKVNSTIAKGCVITYRK